MPYSWLLLLVLGFCLAGAIGTVVVTGRLFLLRSEALISAMALIAFFFLGFAGPFLPHSARWFLAVAGFILFVSTAIFIGYTAKTRWSAGVTGAVFSPLVLFALLIGIYVARSTGWGGLTTLGSGPSSDHRGMELVWFVMLAGAPLWGIAGILTSFLALLAHSRNRSLPSSKEKWRRLEGPSGAPTSSP